MNGVAPAPNNGYYLVKGKGLPRIDVIAGARRVDWPRMVAQLKAATDSSRPTAVYTSHSARVADCIRLVFIARSRLRFLTGARPESEHAHPARGVLDVALLTVETG